MKRASFSRGLYAPCYRLRRNSLAAPFVATRFTASALAPSFPSRFRNGACCEDKQHNKLDALKLVATKMQVLS